MKKRYWVIALIVILGFGIIAGGFFISRSFQSKRVEGSISVKKNERSFL